MLHRFTTASGRSHRLSRTFLPVLFVAALGLGGCAVLDSSSVAAPGATPSSGPATPTPAPIAPATSATPAPEPAQAGTALALLDTVPVRGRAPKTGYDRVGSFGQAWADVDRNGCDTRNDILARDLTDVTTRGGCRVLTGTLADPYTASIIDFVRGQDTSTAVQIDHVVALMNAWETGAQALSTQRRTQLANDPLNLLAVDGPTNSSKGAGDAATWLPPNRDARCAYVARQTSVKAAYGLWMTAAEHDRIGDILSTCPNEPALTSTLVPATGTAGAATPTPSSAPAATSPTAIRTTTPATDSTRIVHPGSYCSPVGGRGVTEAGTAMRCSAPDGGRARWRSA